LKGLAAAHHRDLQRTNHVRDRYSPLVAGCETFADPPARWVLPLHLTNRCVATKGSMIHINLMLTETALRVTNISTTCVDRLVRRYHLEMLFAGRLPGILLVIMSGGVTGLCLAPTSLV
jgi:hypothetical protein